MRGGVTQRGGVSTKSPTGESLAQYQRELRARRQGKDAPEGPPPRLEAKRRRGANPDDYRWTGKKWKLVPARAKAHAKAHIDRNGS